MRGIRAIVKADGGDCHLWSVEVPLNPCYSTSLQKNSAMMKLDLRARFGCTIRDCRRRQGLSQEELGGRAGLHRTYVADVERGARNLSLESITRLARALQVSISGLFVMANGGEDEAVQGTAWGTRGELVEILLVEDDPEDVAMTISAFRQARLRNRLQVVSDGKAALDHLFAISERAGPGERRLRPLPHVILLDLGLPRVSGLEVLQRLKSDPRTCTIAVIVLTGSRSQKDLVACRELGVKHYIVKPVDFERFSRVASGLDLEWALVR